MVYEVKKKVFTENGIEILVIGKKPLPWRINHPISRNYEWIEEGVW